MSQDGGRRRAPGEKSSVIDSLNLSRLPAGCNKRRVRTREIRRVEVRHGKVNLLRSVRNGLDGFVCGEIAGQPAGTSTAVIASRIA
ncbi:MAG: hypothetical protein H7337_11855 [Rhizobacter sp.]|nr:hypothetical protein [Rhizobacter sp.]